MAAKKKTTKKPATKAKASSKRKPAQPKAKKAKRTRSAKVPVGTVIEKTYKGKTLKVTATETGFRFKGKDWRSLTAIALHVTGAKAISGPFFFGLVESKAKRERK